MVLQSQFYPQVAYAQTEDYYTKNGYQHQEDCYSKHDYAQQEKYYSENAYHDNGSSMQQMKPCPNIATPQPSKHHMVGYQGYDQHNNGWDGNHQKYDDYDSHGYDKHPKGKGKLYGDGLYGKPHGYNNNYDSHGYPMHPNGPKTYETISYSYFAEGGRDRCPPNCEHKNQQNWTPNGAEWILKSLDD